MYDPPGVVVTAATGDDGWFGWDEANAGNTSSNGPTCRRHLPALLRSAAPSSSLNAKGTRRNETVWNHDGPANINGIRQQDALGVTGGGCSRWITAPTWQAHVGGYRETGCGKNALAADISADADPDTGFDVFAGYHCPGFLTNCWATTAGPRCRHP